MANITVGIGPISSVITIDDTLAENVVRNYLETMFENTDVDLDTLSNQELLDLYTRQLAKHTNRTSKAKLLEDAKKQSVIDVETSTPEIPEDVD